MLRRKLFFVFLLILLPLVGWARSTPNVPPDDPLYRDLDKLVAFGLVHPPILGQRPYPRSEFARLTAEAMKNFEAKVEGKSDSLKKYVKKRNRERQIEIVLNRLKEEFEEELIDLGAVEGEKKEFRVHPLDEFITYVTYLDSPATTIPKNNGLGNINTQVNPLGDYNLGRHAIDGFQQAEEFTGYFETTKFMSGYFRPRLEVDIPSGVADGGGHVYIQNAYATFRAGNFIFEFGRDSMVWGFGERGSLLYSTNPRPFDGVRITNPTPARLPWVFEHLGEWRYTLYGFNLGPEYSKKWAWLAGYQISLMPAQYVELGFGHAVQIGGEGAATPSFLDVLGEFVGFRPSGTNSGSTNLSNHLFEITSLVRIPKLDGFQIYGNMALEDVYWSSMEKIKKTLKYSASYLGGVYLPSLNSSGSMDFRAEFEKIGAFQYRHSSYKDGYTINRKIIGSDAGPDAYTLHFMCRHTLSPKLWYGLSFDWDHRSSDRYKILSNPDGSQGAIVKVFEGPTEERYRGLLDLDWRFKKHATLHFTGGYERVLNYQYREGKDRNNLLLAATLNLNFDRYFHFAAD